MPSQSQGDTTVNQDGITRSGGGLTLGEGDGTLSGGDATPRGADGTLSGGDATLTGRGVTLRGRGVTPNGGAGFLKIMSVTEIMPEVRSLSRQDKLKLIQLLAQELERDETEIIESNRDYPIWSPDAAFAAGAVMLAVLAENLSARNNRRPELSGHEQRQMPNIRRRNNVLRGRQSQRLHLSHQNDIGIERSGAGGRCALIARFRP